jgi:hypothetical protein
VNGTGIKKVNRGKPEHIKRKSFHLKDVATNENTLEVGDLPSLSVNLLAL